MLAIHLVARESHPAAPTLVTTCPALPPKASQLHGHDRSQNEQAGPLSPKETELAAGKTRLWLARIQRCSVSAEGGETSPLTGGDPQPEEIS